MKFTEYQIVEGIGYITLNRPEKRNALNEAFVDELKGVFDSAMNDDNCKVIVLKANGKAFCAGADLAYLQNLQKNTFEENKADSQNLRELFEAIHRCPKVVIAQIEGHALAGGCGLATLADYSFSVPNAKFGYTEVKIGFIPAIVMVFLIRKIGEGKARDILLSGEVFDAAKANDLGLINQVVDNAQIEKLVRDFALNLIKSNSKQSMAKVKEMMTIVQDMTLEDALDYAVLSNAEGRATEDCKKGIKAFLNKEDLKWG